MSLSIVTFADLGNKKNLKTFDILSVIEKFTKEDPLRQVICRRAEDVDATKVVVGISTPVFYIEKLFTKFFKKFFTSHQIEWYLVDQKAKKKLQRTDIVLFHPVVFQETIQAVKRKGGVTVGIATTAFPKIASDLGREESEILGLANGTKEKGISTQIKSIENLDYIIAISPFVAGTYAKDGFPKENIYVAYSDPGEEYLADVVEKKDDVFRVVYVAHTSVLKGLHYLLDAWKSLDIKNAELVIVGDLKVPKSLRERYLALINADNSIRFVGFTKHGVMEYLDQSSVFVFPSLTEGNPRVVMEAMARELPIVTTENAQSIVIDGKDGFVVPIRNPEAIAEKIQYLYDNPNERERMGKEARKSIENKDPFGDAVYEIYQEIMEKEGR